mmetsp:Transcript_12630/g.35975  ORF Transcript_12630/g.35975 Transcript_12630/m.35975 type:complete len:205 (-) Transcript_12630:414-1028(-)
MPSTAGSQVLSCRPAVTPTTAGDQSRWLKLELSSCPVGWASCSVGNASASAACGATSSWRASCTVGWGCCSAGSASAGLTPRLANSSRMALLWCGLVSANTTGVFPLLASTAGSALQSRSSLTALTSPRPAAQCRGVKPRLSCAFTSALCLQRHSMAPMLNCSAATCKGVRQFLGSSADMSHLAARSSFSAGGLCRAWNRTGLP